MHLESCCPARVTSLPCRRAKRRASRAEGPVAVPEPTEVSTVSHSSPVYIEKKKGKVFNCQCPVCPDRQLCLKSWGHQCSSCRQSWLWHLSMPGTSASGRPDWPLQPSALPLHPHSCQLSYPAASAPAQQASIPLSLQSSVRQQQQLKYGLQTSHPAIAE